MDLMLKLALWVPPLLFAVIIHEYSHGRVAEQLGDPTARLMGRLTFNPIPHIDIVGSILFPGLLFLASGGNMLFGWAKPVPVNPYNLRNPKRDMVWISLAGPGANLAAALACGLLIRMMAQLGLGAQGAWFPVHALLLFGLMINIVLALFNLIPIPPLDGSKVLAGFLSYRLYVEYMKLERYGMFIIIGLLILGQVLGIHILGTIIMPALGLLVRLFSGIELGRF